MNNNPITDLERLLLRGMLACGALFLLLAAAAVRVETAKTQLRRERDTRYDLEERVDGLHRSMDGALDEINRLRQELGDDPRADQ